MRGSLYVNDVGVATIRRKLYFSLFRRYACRPNEHTLACG
jgi:hypothetical protein